MALCKDLLQGLPDPRMQPALLNSQVRVGEIEEEEGVGESRGILQCEVG